MASFMGVSFVPTKEGVVVYFEGIDPNAVAGETGQFFHWQGYRLEEGHPFSGLYGKGSVAGRFLAGGFADRTKILVRIEPENQYCRLTVTKAMSGMGGGVLGYHKMNKELERLRQNLFGFFMTPPAPPPGTSPQPGQVPAPYPPQPMPPQAMPPQAIAAPETSYTVGRSVDMHICVEDALVSWLPRAPDQCRRQVVHRRQRCLHGHLPQRPTRRDPHSRGTDGSNRPWRSHCDPTAAHSLEALSALWGGPRRRSQYGGGLRG